MKKSMLAATVVATAFAASANAGYFAVSNAQVDGTNVSGGAFNMTTSANVGWTGTNGAAQQANTMAAGDVTTFSSIGLSGALTANTLTYFGFTSGSLGYFGIAFDNTSGSSVSLDMDFTRLNQATQGVLVAGATGGGSGTYDSASGLGTWSTTNITVDNGQTLYVVFGGFVSNHTPSIQGTVNFNANTNVEYLSWSTGTTWSSIGTGSGLTSNMQFATFVVPVPAPALLAGAGLVGAAALRRRMAKKA